jgi:hypothetical protein
MPGRNQEKGTRVKPGANQLVKVHSMAALLDGGDFVGNFQVSDHYYPFTYSPIKAEIAGNRLVLLGKMTLVGTFRHLHSQPGVRAVLASTQGGLGAPPAVYSRLAPAASIAASGNPGDTRPAPSSSADQPPPPATDNTGTSAFCGVMYFHLEGLPMMMGVPADLSHTQLNVRLFPTDDLGRKFHSVYSRLVAALFERNWKEAADLVEDLNQLIKEGAQASVSTPTDWPLMEMGPPDAAPGR